MPDERAPLRLGILVDALEQPAWVHQALELSLASGRACVAAVILNDDAKTPGPSSGKVDRWWRNRRTLLFALYNRFDRWRFPVPRDPFTLVDIRPLIGDAPIEPVTPRQTKHSDYFEESDVERLLAHDLDVALRFGFRILRGRSLQIARHGVWSYHHGDNRVNRGGPPAFWEVMEGQPATGVVLQVLSEELDAGKTLSRLWTQTDRFSVRRNRAECYWAAAPMISRALRDLAQSPASLSTTPNSDSGKGSGTSSDADDLVAYGQRLYIKPSNRELMPYLVRLAAGYTRDQIRQRTSREQWFLAYRHAPRTGATHVTPDLTPFRFRTLDPPADRFWADPFPARHGDGHVILFEELLYSVDRGRISMLEIDARGRAGSPVTVLERDYHLSYPFLLQHGGEWYMLPECDNGARVEIYRATRFPHEWTQEGALDIGLQLVDATLHEIDGRWWMFGACVDQSGHAWTELHIFSAIHPFGPWAAHRRNPVVTDVRSARPAGRLFRHGGAWYRPAQDCSRGYGSAINLQRIERIDDGGYSERTVTRLEPRWRPDLVGTHTINAVDGLTVIDARRRRSRGWPAPR